MTEDFGLLKYYLDAGQELSTEEWEQLLTSGKDLIKARLNSRKVILKLEVSQAAGSERRAAATRYRKKMEEEIKTEVVEVLDHLDNRLKAAEDGDGKFKEFGLKMRDKYVKYLAMVTDRRRLVELDDSALQHVFSFLDVNSLKTVRLVSRRWKYVAELPSLWSGACLMMRDANYRDILNSDLVKVVDSLKLRLRHTACKARVLLGLFGSVSVLRGQLEALFQACSKPSSRGQLEALFQAIIASDNSTLKSLSLFSCFISGHGLGWSPALFQAMIKLEELKLSGCILSSDCLTAMFEVIRSSLSAGKLKLKKLDLRGLKLVDSPHDPKLLQSIVALKEENGLDQLTTPRLSVIFETLSAGHGDHRVVLGVS